MSDAYRLQAAVELELATLPAGTSLAQERWTAAIAAILSTADNAAQRRWSEDNVSDAVHMQLQQICLALSSVPSLPLLQQRHMDNGLTARWLIDPEHGPSSRQACPKGVYVALTAALPDDVQTISAVPLGHNTVPQDCAKILEERTIRPSYYDRGDDTWILSLDFFCQLKFPLAAIRAPILDGTQWSHLRALEQTCLSARKYGGTETAPRPTCALAWLYMKQHAHIKAAVGFGVYDSTFSHYFDIVRGTNGRWLAPSVVLHLCLSSEQLDGHDGGEVEGRVQNFATSARFLFWCQQARRGAVCVCCKHFSAFARLGFQQQ